MKSEAVYSVCASWRAVPRVKENWYLAVELGISTRCFDANARLIAMASTYFLMLAGCGSVVINTSQEQCNYISGNIGHVGTSSYGVNLNILSDDNSQDFPLPNDFNILCGHGEAVFFRVTFLTSDLRCNSYSLLAIAAYSRMLLVPSFGTRHNVSCQPDIKLKAQTTRKSSDFSHWRF
ncbi:hypothetical protein ACH5RR_008982 [Cinchona calisaya]|uniref:Uncharacterized protein n=1 Tax=Cinchona calisaya TaxID=153742 RepID=A0ABD3AGI2_9GENT